MTRRSDSGFTLIELLIALAIAGLAAGAVVLTLPSAGAGLTQETTRLAAKLRTASDLAVLRARFIGLELTESGYRFVQLEAGEWRPLEAESGLAPRKWPAPTTVRPAGSQTTATDAPASGQGSAPPAIRFAPIGLAEPFTVTLARGGRRIALSGDRAGAIAVEARDG